MYGIIVAWLLATVVGLVNSENATVATQPPDTYLEECIAESKANREAVSKLKSGNWNKSDDALKKWTLCYLVKRGVMSTAGVLSQGVVLRDILDKDKEKVEQIINKCLYKKAHDPVETAWHYITCFQKKGPKYAKLANGI